MKRIVLLLALCGCSRDAPISETIADNAINTLNAIEQGLPAECKSESTLTNFIVAKSEVRNIRKACDMEKDKINRERLKWMWSFWGLVVAICAFVARRILR